MASDGWTWGKTGCASVCFALIAIGCGSGNPDVEGPSTVRVQHVALALDGYRDRGFLAGTIEFPVVGRLILLQGPADSAWLGFAASMSPAALRFLRQRSLVVWPRLLDRILSRVYPLHPCPRRTDGR